MRLGDDIDDYCSRCKRSMDHSVVAMNGEEVLKTRCRTCGNEHAYKHNENRKKEMTAKDAFDILMSRAQGSMEEQPKGKKKKN